MRLKTIAAVVVLALAAGALLTACGSDDNDDSTATTAETTAAATTESKPKPAPKPAIDTIVIRDGAPVGGVQELEYDAGEEIRFRVRSNTADEVHVHGYDVSKDVPAGGSATISFPADIEGIFEVEMHGSGQQIAELRVNP